MTYQNALSRRASIDAAPVPRDHNIAAIPCVLLALVFAPAVGLHVALAAFGPELVATSPATSEDGFSQRAGSPAKDTRG